MRPEATVRREQRNQAVGTLHARLADLLLIDGKPMLYVQCRGVRTFGGKSMTLLLPFLLDRHACPWFAAPELAQLLGLWVADDGHHPMLYVQEGGPDLEDRFATWVSVAWFGQPNRLLWTVLR